ncbi:MAG TPA: amidohydrolase family protein [Pirellulales bacterium]|nr:amidohydrolase family protein [Pirellulales bacterium]
MRTSHSQGTAREIMNTSPKQALSSRKERAPQLASRRDFCRWAAALGGTLLAQDRARGAQTLPVGRYVDVHTHLGQTWNTTQPLSAAQLLAWMDASDVAQAVVLPLVSPESSSYPLTTDFALAETKAHRQRLIPFCSVDPRTSYNGGLRGLVDMLKRYVELGAQGFGEHKPGVKIDDPRNMTIYEACGELKLPVLFHLDELRNVDAVGLPGLERALKEFPQTVFIGHGPGWWASISGQLSQADLARYPDGPIAAGGAIDALMSKYPNLYGDLSAGSGARAISRDTAFGREFLIRRADRLLFGTDYLAPGQDVPQLTLFRQLQLPAEVQNKIFRDNARTLLRLS